MRDYSDLLLEAQANVQRRMQLLMEKLMLPQMKTMAQMAWAEMDDKQKEQFKTERPQEYAQLMGLLS